MCGRRSADADVYGGGQEAGLRAGTENMAGIAALGAVLSAIEDGTVFQPLSKLEDFAATLIALREVSQGSN